VHEVVGDFDAIASSPKRLRLKHIGIPALDTGPTSGGED
jgi:hypothetical protein